jgi:uncharacterized repeat protein (TIGR01451 family)
MSTGGKFGRLRRRRNVVGATAIVAFVVVALLTAGAASGRTASQQSGRLAAASSGVSASSSSASLLPSSGGSSQTLAPITGCGADGTIADASGFEDADGNLAIDTAGCMDWNGFTPTWTGTAPFQTGTASNNGWMFAGATDAFNSTSDSIYAGGVKQDTVCPATVTGKANDKADLAAMYVATQKIGDQTYLMLAWERQLDTTVQSDVFVSFELNQGNVSCGAGSPFVQRTVGDLLIEYNFQSGNSTIDVQEWNGTTWVPLPTPPYEAAVNTGTVTDTIRPDGPVDLTQFEFGEAGINLTALDLTGNGGKACETFGSVLGSSRTSKSGDTAQLKDFVGPAPFDISTCTQPTVTTTLKNAAGDATIPNGSSIAFGSSVYDTATLGNLVNGQTPTGKVQYTFFTNGDCSGTGTSAGLVTLANDGSVPKSDTEGPLAAGSYSFNAQYLSGNDPNYSDSAVSACEPFTVLKTSPTLSTVQDPAVGNVGDTYKDKAILSGSTAGAGTSITWKLYDAADCGGTVLDTETVSTNGDGTYETPVGFAIHSAGTYYWVASYLGDANNNNAGPTGCNDEPVTVNGAAIHIVKTPDAAQVNAGEQIGFTLTVYNTGAGDAHGVKLSDTLPVKDGLSWSIASQGAGWAGSCAIDAGVLTCGGANGVTVPAGTTQAASTFTVHITSPTTTATGGVCPGGSGVINNTGHVETSNDGSGDSTASTCVAAPAIHIVKTADAAQVNAGSPIGFTLTVYNTGSGAAHGVKLNDTLPTNPGLSWSIASQGAGWAGSCAIASGVLTCGGANGVTVPAGTTQATSTFTVHITSPTTGATGGDCPTTGVVNNTGSVTTTNDGSDQSSASTCVQAVVDLSITKSGSPATQDLGQGNITWTMVVKNNGPSADSGVKVTDPMPAGNTFVSATTTKGTCTGGATLTCTIGDMAAGESVTITLVTTPTATGTQTNTAVVAGNRPESNLANNTATASVEVTAPFVQPACVKISRLTPGHLIVGRKTVVTIRLTRQGGPSVKGIRVQIKGAGINVKTQGANSQGIIKHTLTMKKKGILTFTPLASPSCGAQRIGVRGVFTPPVTG